MRIISIVRLALLCLGMMFPGKGDGDNKCDGRIDDLVAQLGVDRSQLTYPLGEAALLYAQQLSGGQQPLHFPMPVDPSILSSDGQSYFHWTNEVQSRFEKAVDELIKASQEVTPKAVVKKMGIKELRVKHIKGHLKEYIQKEDTENESSDGKPENSTTKGKTKFSTNTRASSQSGDPEGETDSFSLEELEDMLSLDSDDMDPANHAEVQDISMVSSLSNEIHRQQQIDSMINDEDCAFNIGIEESLLLQSELNIDFPLSTTAQKNHKMQSDFIMEGGLNVGVQKNHYMQPEVMNQSNAENIDSLVESARHVTFPDMPYEQLSMQEQYQVGSAFSLVPGTPNFEPLQVSSESNLNQFSSAYDALLPPEVDCLPHLYTEQIPHVTPEFSCLQSYNQVANKSAGNPYPSAAYPTQNFQPHLLNQMEPLQNIPDDGSVTGCLNIIESERVGEKDKDACAASLKWIEMELDKDD